jgi:hypothetical protein
LSGLVSDPGGRAGSSERLLLRRGPYADGEEDEQQGDGFLPAPPMLDGEERMPWMRDNEEDRTKKAVNLPWRRRSTDLGRELATWSAE